MQAWLGRAWGEAGREGRQGVGGGLGGAGQGARGRPWGEGEGAMGEGAGMRTLWRAREARRADLLYLLCCMLPEAAFVIYTLPIPLLQEPRLSAMVVYRSETRFRIEFRSPPRRDAGMVEPGKSAGPGGSAARPDAMHGCGLDGPARWRSLACAALDDPRPWGSTGGGAATIRYYYTTIMIILYYSTTERTGSMALTGVRCAQCRPSLVSNKLRVEPEVGVGVGVGV